jgi:hypothetical protein
LSVISPELRAKRFPLHLPVKYRGQGENRWFTGTTDNVSCSGMLLRGRHVLSTAAKVELMLTLPSQIAGEAQLLARCSGEVVRKDRKLPSRDSVLGISVAACEFLKGDHAGERGAESGSVNPDLPGIVQGLYDMLVVILGSSEIILADPLAGENARQHAALIRQAAVRGGTVLGQLSPRNQNPS